MSMHGLKMSKDIFIMIWFTFKILFEHIQIESERLYDLRGSLINIYAVRPNRKHKGSNVTFATSRDFDQTVHPDQTAHMCRQDY